MADEKVLANEGGHLKEKTLVDDLLYYTDKTYFPATGAADKEYVDKTTGSSYLWSGSEYVLTGTKYEIDIEVTDSSKGIILKSPNGTRWRLTIDDDGLLTQEDL